MAAMSTPATHLLQSGVDIAVVALRLSHESIETTHSYIQAHLDMTEGAVDKLTPHRVSEPIQGRRFYTAVPVSALNPFLGRP